jgi:hypothetical protein
MLYCRPIYTDYTEKASEAIKNFYKKYKKEKTMDKRDNITNIVIEGDGKKTVALVASDKNGRIIETVSAHCAPEDVYNFNIGAKLCMDRLYNGYDFTPKPKRKPFNGLLHVILDEDTMDIFRIVDGKIDSVKYVLRCPIQQKDTIYEDSSFEEMKQALLNCASFTWHDGKPPKAISRERGAY